MRLTRNNQESGSIPLALLASIVVGGLVIVLAGTILQSERSVRFDRSYTEVVQTADAGVQTAYHRLNETGADPLAHPTLAALEVGDVSAEFVTQLKDSEARWTVRRLSARGYEVTSTGRTPDDVERTVVATVEKDSLFFPGAFGDRLVAMNGTSTQIDSYESNSATCVPATATTCWGTDVYFGTRKAALGTNNDFDFSGNTKVLRGILYDWDGNPGLGATATNPGGDRCVGNPCKEPDVIRTEGRKLEYGSDSQMQFIADKLDACDPAQTIDNWVLGNSKKNDPPVKLFLPGGNNDGSPADPKHTQYYCADSLQIIGDVVLPDATPQQPLVIFVRNSFSQAGHTHVNLACLATNNCPGNFNQDWRNVRPKAESLQIYVQTEAAAKGANVMIDQHAVFAGVMYSPRATCGSSGNAGVHVYGSLICRNIDNVGNWRFHYDEALADASRGTFTLASWREEAPPA
jgi:hypothetical protein